MNRGRQGASLYARARWAVVVRAPSGREPSWRAAVTFIRSQLVEAPLMAEPALPGLEDIAPSDLSFVVAFLRDHGFASVREPCC